MIVHPLEHANPALTLKVDGHGLDPAIAADAVVDPVFEFPVGDDHPAAERTKARRSVG